MHSQADLKAYLIDLDKYKIFVRRSGEMLIKDRNSKETIYRGEKPVITAENAKNPRIIFYDGQHFFLSHGTEILVGDLAVGERRGTMVYSSGEMPLHEYLRHRENAEKIRELGMTSYLRDKLQKYLQDKENPKEIEKLVKTEEAVKMGNGIKGQILRRYIENFMREEKFPASVERWAMRRANEQIKNLIKNHETNSRGDRTKSYI